MMWTEITDKDDKLIEDFLRIQTRLSDYYRDNLNFDDAKADLGTSTLRAFIYRDADHELNLVTILLKDGMTMQLRTVGIGKSVDMNLALDPILFGKIKEVMGEYGVSQILATYGADVLPQVKKFYDGITQGLIKKGFAVMITQPRADIVKFSGPLVDAAKDEPLDRIPNPTIEAVVDPIASDPIVIP